jgi:polysaccharide export outer membrane protein
MKKRSRYFIILLILLGCTTAGGKKALTQEDLENTSVPPIRLSEFIIGPGDSLAIDVWRHPDLKSVMEVQNNGEITFPLVGSMRISGMGLTEFQNLLTERLSKYLVNPQVRIQVTSPKSHKIYVLGEVLRPGVYLLENPTTATEAIGLAGGFNLSAKRNKVLLMRRKGDGLSKPVVLQMGTGDIQKGGDVNLQAGDVLYVPLSNVALVDRFFGHLSIAVGSIIGIEQGIVGYPPARNIIKNKDETGGTVNPIIVISPQ